MASDIPFTDIKFKHLLSHTFPGFFSAITLFMLVDVWSPLNITGMAIKDLTGFATFVGFILLIGTILGIILDGIHHSVIEDLIFDQSDRMKEINKIKKCWIYTLINEDTKKLFYSKDDKSKDSKPEDTSEACNGKCYHCEKDECIIGKFSLTRHISFKKIETKLTEINSYLVDDFYSYSEFYSNTFLAIIPFSLISPHYLFQNLEVPWEYSLSFGFFAFILGVFCLYSSFTSYITYGNVVNSIMMGYINAKSTASQSTQTSSVNVLMINNRAKSHNFLKKVIRR